MKLKTQRIKKFMPFTISIEHVEEALILYSLIGESTNANIEKALRNRYDINKKYQNIRIANAKKDFSYDMYVKISNELEEQRIIIKQ